MYRIFAAFIALFVLWKAPGCFYRSPSHRSVAVHNLEQNISKLVIEIFFKVKLDLDLYKQLFKGKFLFKKTKYRFNYLK